MTTTVRTMDARECAFIVACALGHREELREQHNRELRELMGDPIEDRSEHAGGSELWRSERVVRAAERPWTDLRTVGATHVDADRPFAGAFRLLTTDGQHIGDGLVPNAAGDGFAVTRTERARRARAAQGEQRKHATNADRQRAYRERKRAEKLRAAAHIDDRLATPYGS